MKEFSPGHVAYFDILGYSAVEPKIMIRMWRRIIPELKVVVKGLANPQDAISYRLVGDSVFLFSQQAAETDPYLILVCAILFGRMFEYGLPMRGAIATGEFFQHGQIWAGKPIVEAHRCAESLSASACVATDSASELARTSSYFAQHSVPFRNKGTCRYEAKDLFVLKFLKIYDLGEILSKFAAHGKSVVSPGVQTKALATEQLMKTVGTVTPNSRIKD